MTEHEHERLRRLEKRALWLEQRFLKNNQDFTYDRAEWSALKWAIQIIKDYFKLSTPTGEEKEEVG